METGKEIIKEIQLIKKNLTNESVFKDKDTLSNFLSIVEVDKRYEVFTKAYKDFSTLVYANTKELHENLEVFYQNEQDLMNARKEANSLNQSFFDDLFKTQLVEEIFILEKEKIRKSNEEKEKYIEVSGKKYEVIKKIDVYWTGWECDNYAYLVKIDDDNGLVVSNHGSKYFTDKKFLEDKIKEYQEAIKESQILVAMLN